MGSAELPKKRTHFIIPDTQAAPGDPTDHLYWAGQYMVDQFKGDDLVVIHLGDHWDMESLSAYDKGKKSMEGKRYIRDIEAGNEAFAILNEPLERYNANQQATKHKQWWPERHLLRGNHEDRITRASEADAQLDGLISLDSLLSPGWEVHPFLEIVDIDGISYAHYFVQQLTGRPLGGEATTKLKNLGFSFVQGHVQTYQTAVRYVAHRQQRGIVAGAYYLADQKYKGPQTNAHWRGLIVCHQVSNGEFDVMEVNISYLCERYEGKTLQQFMGKTWSFG